MLGVISILSIIGYFSQLFFKKSGPSTILGVIMILSVWNGNLTLGIIFLVVVSVIFILKLFGWFSD